MPPFLTVFLSPLLYLLLSVMHAFLGICHSWLLFFLMSLFFYRTVTYIYFGKPPQPPVTYVYNYILLGNHPIKTVTLDGIGVLLMWWRRPCCLFIYPTWYVSHYRPIGHACHMTCRLPLMLPSEASDCETSVISWGTNDFVEIHRY